MPEHYSDDDSDEELGAYIYSISRTAKLLREQEEEATIARKNNELTTNNNDKNNITRPNKRKRPHEVENIPVSSSEQMKVSLEQKQPKIHTFTCNQGCLVHVVEGGVCIGAMTMTKRNNNMCSHEALFTNQVREFMCSHEGFTNQVRNGGYFTRHGALSQVWNTYSEGRTNYNDPPVSLHIESDTTFLPPIHNFLRTKCIEIFVATQRNIDAPGRGSRKKFIGQLGLQCIHCKDSHAKPFATHRAKQAICYPSRRDTIFEAVRNFERKHLGVCPLIPPVIMAEYNKLLNPDDVIGLPLHKSKHILKVYYAQAASELGIVDSTTHNGLVYDKSRVNTSGVPSQKLQTIIEASASRSKFDLLFTPTGRSRLSLSSTSLGSNKYSNINSKLEMKKFEHVCSEATRKVLMAARNDPTIFVAPQDFSTVSDEHYLLFHQLKPITKMAADRRHVGPGRRPKHLEVVQPEKVHNHDVKNRCGLCCKHCVLFNNGGVYFPADPKALSESSFNMACFNHLMNCHNVPIEIKNAFGELKSLAVKYGVRTKRGSRLAFCEKIWGRMEDYLTTKEQGGEVKEALSMNKGRIVRNCTQNSTTEDLHLVHHGNGGVQL